MVELARSPQIETVQTTPIKVVAAIPCYNTERTIASVVARTQRYVEEVIVIDDGSTDLTADLAKEAGALVVSHDKNLVSPDKAAYR